MIIFLFWLMLALQVTALLGQCLWQAKAKVGPSFAISVLGLSWLANIALLWLLKQSDVALVTGWFKLDPVNLLLGLLIASVSLVIHRFSLNYLSGDALYQRYFFFLSALSGTATLMVFADNLLLFGLAWLLSNLLLVALMQHKKSWSAARYAAQQALAMLGLGSLALLIALLMLGLSFGSHSLSSLNPSQVMDSYPVYLALSLLLLAALLQSAIWPFHRWLLNSLNAPTPVSAFMHAGLVNGGGILLVKFSPFFLLYPALLKMAFILGAASAFIGALWKLIQPDIKRALACSTLSQMGFMMMQCGLGLFAAAITHLCWHGLFKAYLFLSAGSAVAQQKLPAQRAQKPLAAFLIALLGGLAASLVFGCASHKPLATLDSRLFLLFFAFMAGAQLSLSMVKNSMTATVIGLALVSASGFGGIYGTSVHGLERLLNAALPSPVIAFSGLQGLVMLLFFLFWLAINFLEPARWQASRLFCALYMRLLNSSQPSAKAMTAIRTDYHY